MENDKQKKPVRFRDGLNEPLSKRAKRRQRMEAAAKAQEPSKPEPEAVSQQQQSVAFFQSYFARIDQIRAGQREIFGEENPDEPAKQKPTGRLTYHAWKDTIKRWHALDFEGRQKLAAEAPAPFWMAPEVEWEAVVHPELKYSCLRMDAEADEFFRECAPLKPFFKIARERGMELSELLRKFVEIEAALQRNPDLGLMMMLDHIAQLQGIPPEQFRPWAKQHMADATLACVTLLEAPVLMPGLGRPH